MDIEDQRREIEDLRQQMGNEATVTNLTTKLRVEKLEKENAELRLYLASLIRYLGHRGLLDQKEFAKLVETIDVEDGEKDGGYRGNIMK